MTISSKLIRDAASTLPIGEQMHINHEGCSMGEDRKRRLYIKRTDRGLVAYCHHCGDKGFASTSTEDRLRSWATKPKAIKMETEVPVPAVTMELPIAAKIWLKKYSCLYDSGTGLRSFRGISISTPAGVQPYKCGLVLRNQHGIEMGYQIRNLTNEEPKYVSSYESPEWKGSPTWFAKANKTLVITEDYLSAFRVYQDTEYSSCALLRTSLTDRALFHILAFRPTRVLIWLDPDAAGKKGADVVYKQLTHFLPSGIKIEKLEFLFEPKQCPPEALPILI